MTFPRHIPERFRDEIAAMPETGYGVNRVAVILDDGALYVDVLVAWASEIIKVGASEALPFDPARIVEVRPG